MSWVQVPSLAPVFSQQAITDSSLVEAGRGFPSLSTMPGPRKSSAIPISDRVFNQEAGSASLCGRALFDEESAFATPAFVKGEVDESYCTRGRCRSARPWPGAAVGAGADLFP